MPNMKISPMTIRATRRKSRRFASDMFTSPNGGSLPDGCASRQRPRDSSAAKCDQQFPPSDGDCHTPLPCEVRREKDITPRACCPSAHGPGGAFCFQEIYFGPRVRPCTHNSWGEPDTPAQRECLNDPTGRKIGRGGGWNLQACHRRHTLFGSDFQLLCQPCIFFRIVPDDAGKLLWTSADRLLCHF